MFLSLSHIGTRFSINQHHHIWLAWKRKIIGGVAKSLYDKIDELLDAYLHEQHKMSEADLWEE